MEEATRNAFSIISQLRGFCDESEVELEARIKGPIVRRDTVAKLLAYYNMREGVEYVELRNKSNTDSQANAHRCIDNGNVVCKSKLRIYKYPNEWLSIVVSFEVDTGSREMLSHRHFIETTKTRYSKLLCDGAMRLDITHFNDDDLYQVEVEALDYQQPETFMTCVRKVIDILQDSPFYIPRKKFDAVRRIIGGEGYYSSTIASMNAKGSVTIDRSSEFSIYRGKYQKPIALTKRRLPIIFRKGTYMTVKLDGARRFVVAFNGMVYDVEPEHLHVRLLSTTSPYKDPFPSIVDAELVDGTYNVFDICSFEGWYVGREGLSQRMSYAHQWTTSFVNTIDCALKEYKKVSQKDPVGDIGAFYERYRDGASPVDGLIFTNEDLAYTDKVIKWKEHVTVDLMWQSDGTIDDRIVSNTIDVSDIDVGRYGSGIYEFEVLGVVEDDEVGPKLDLKVMRFRDDKKVPNHSSTIVNNVESLELRGIWNGYGCLLMRQYHNATKRKLLKKVCTKGCTILDIGSGQGGDLSKWGIAKKVYCVEPSANAVKELKRRLSEKGIRKKVDVIQCPLSDTRTICGKVTKVDVLALFFCANFFTKADMDALKEIVAKYQPKDIIGTFLDSRLIRYGTHPPCYEILPDGDAYHIRLFGTRIDQREYLLNIDQLRLKGYKIVDSQPLDGDELMSVNERELSRQFRIFHLQR